MARPRAYNHDIRCPHCGSNWTPKDGPQEASRHIAAETVDTASPRTETDTTILRRPFARRSTCTRKKGAYRLWHTQWTSTSLLCSPGSKKASWAQRALDIERRIRTPPEPELSATVRKIRGIDAHRRRAKVISFDEMWTYVGVRRGEGLRSVWIWTAVVEERDGERWMDFEVGDMGDLCEAVQKTA